MSDDEHFSLHSFDPDNNIDNDIDQFYKKLSL